MDNQYTDNTTGPACERFETHLMAYLERDLDADTLAWMEHHREHCTACAVVVRELDDVVVSARALPAFSPPRDLWPAIVEQLATPVIAIDQGGAQVHRSSTHIAPGSAPARSRKTWLGVGGESGVRVRHVAIAATVLVALSSAVTWQIVRSPAPQAVVASAFDSVAESAQIRPAASVNVVYQTEIDALRAVVNERYAELDSTTVAVLKRNLDVIDQAIADCREALAKDPNNRILSTTLDRTLASKLALMRQVALL